MYCVLYVLCAEAQTFTERLQKQTNGKGTVTIRQDKEIDQLVNGRYSDPNAAGMRPDVKPGKPTKENKEKESQKQKTTPASKQSTTTNAKQQDSQAQQDELPKTDSELDTNKKVMRNSHKTTGYRVQVWAGGNSRVDRQKAEQAGLAIKRNIPGEPVYVHFYSPRWICRIGNYRTYEEAYAILQQVKQIGYKEAIIVKGQITVKH